MFRAVYESGRDAWLLRLKFVHPERKLKKRVAIKK